MWLENHVELTYFRRVEAIDIQPTVNKTQETDLAVQNGSLTDGTKSQSDSNRCGNLQHLHMLQRATTEAIISWEP